VRQLLRSARWFASGAAEEPSSLEIEAREREFATILFSQMTREIRRRQEFPAGNTVRTDSDCSGAQSGIDTPRVFRKESISLLEIRLMKEKSPLLAG